MDWRNSDLLCGTVIPQIRFILLQNRQGKTRLAKYYIPLEDTEKHKLEYEVNFIILFPCASKKTYFVCLSCASQDPGKGKVNVCLEKNDFSYYPRIMISTNKIMR